MLRMKMYFLHNICIVKFFPCMLLIFQLLSKIKPCMTQFHSIFLTYISLCKIINFFVPISYRVLCVYFNSAKHHINADKFRFFFSLSLSVSLILFHYLYICERARYDLSIELIGHFPERLILSRIM